MARRSWTRSTRWSCAAVHDHGVAEPLQNAGSVATSRRTDARRQPGRAASPYERFALLPPSTKNRPRCRGHPRLSSAARVTAAFDHWATAVDYAPARHGRLRSSPASDRFRTLGNSTSRARPRAALRMAMQRQGSSRSGDVNGCGQCARLMHVAAAPDVGDRDLDRLERCHECQGRADRDLVDDAR